MKKEIIVILISLTIISGSSYLIWDYSKNKNEQKNIENNQSREKKKENNQQLNSTDEQLTSYFLVAFIPIGILFLLNRLDKFCKVFDKLYHLTPPKVDDNFLKNKLKCYYLILIKTILEIIVYEKNVNLINNKLPVLKFDLHRFLDQFLFGSQAGKHEVRQETQAEVIGYLEREKQHVLIRSLTKFTIAHLFAFLFNFILNFFQHGVQTWKRLKWNSLWKMIPNLQYKYERIIAYFLFFLPLGEYFSQYFFGYHFCNDPKCIYQKNDLGRYWLVRIVFSYYRQYYFFKQLSSLPSPEFNFVKKTIYLVKKPRISIDHRNLDAKIYPLETDFDDPQRIIDQGKQFRTKSCRKFINDMGKLLDPNNQFEQKVLTKVKKFVNNEK